ITQVNYGAFRSMQTSLLKTGEEFGAFYGYQADGVYNDDAELSNSPIYPGARKGGAKYKDINGDGKIDPADRTIIGSPHPDFVYTSVFAAADTALDLTLLI